jgi:hypothetical protein
MTAKLRYFGTKAPRASALARSYAKAGPKDQAIGQNVGPMPRTMSEAKSGTGVTFIPGLRHASSGVL